jgi:uncharacterized protein (TIRG00374 family)
MKLKNFLPLIGLLLFLIILSQLDYDQILSIFLGLNPLYILLSFFVFIPLLFLATVEWQLLLKKQKINVSFWYTIKNFFIGFFYGFITPGAIGGYTRSLYLSKESNEPLAKCVSNIVTYNAIEFIAMLAVGFVGALFLTSVYPYLFLVILIVVVLSIILYLFFFKSSHAKVIFNKIIHWDVLSGITDQLRDSIESFHKDLPKLKDVILPFSISITGWLLKYTMLFFIAQLFFIPVSFYYFILIMAVADVFASIPISIYGIGTREAALITMFSVPQFTNGAIISPEQIVSMSLFWFVIIWLVPSIIGAFVTISETRRSSEFKLDEDNCKDFERYMVKYPELYLKLARIVKETISSVSHPVIIDLGVGPGLLSKELAKMIPQAKIIGIDPASSMLKRAKQNAKIEAHQGVSDDLPLEDNSIDAIVTRFSLTYWDNPEKSFQEIRRVLKPGGFFIIEALNKDFSSLKLGLIKLHMMMNRSGIAVARYHIDAYKTAYRLETVKDLFEKTGFTVSRIDAKKNDWKYMVIGRK